MNCHKRENKVAGEKKDSDKNERDIRYCKKVRVRARQLALFGDYSKQAIILSRHQTPHEEERIMEDPANPVSPVRKRHCSYK